MTIPGIEGGRSDLGRSLLARKDLTSDWVPSFAAVPRSAFLPDVMWPYDMDTGRTETVDRRSDPDRWYHYADANGPIVTQWDDGDSDGPGSVSTSSASMPSVVFRMLRDLDVHAGHRVLEVGTGTGWNAALLAHRLGIDNVVTAEIDSAVAATARERLCHFGLPILVLERDGAEGDAPGAPYDRIIATAGLRAFPPAWLSQVRPGGLIVAPWGTHYSHQDAVARLVVGSQGLVSGRFTGPVQFMKLRAQRLPEVAHREYVPGGVAGADRSTTAVTEEQLLGKGRFAAVTFALGLRVRDCGHSPAPKRDGQRPVWLYGLGDRSWACVMFHDDRPDADVYQYGTRRLWDEVADALAWWQDAGEPGYDRFGLTITADSQRAWLDDPSASWKV